MKKGADMKSEITNILIDFRSWGDRCPCLVAIVTAENSVFDQYIDSAKDVISVLETELKTSYLTRETQICIKYRTDTQIPLTMNCAFDMYKILYFRNKPKYGIDFFPPIKTADEERKELVKSIFSNADEILQEEIYEVFEYLLNTGVQK